MTTRMIIVAADGAEEARKATPTAEVSRAVPMGEIPTVEVSRAVPMEEIPMAEVSRAVPMEEIPTAEVSPMEAANLDGADHRAVIRRMDTMATRAT